MSNVKDVMLSVAQVCDLEPGDEENATWINPGFTGVVREVASKKSKAGKPFYPCIIADMTGPETIEVSFFNRRPPFAEGDVVDIFGKGLRRTEFNGNAQASLGRETEIAVVGQSAHEPEQRHAAATGAPAVNGKPQPVLGQTVGMAMKEALALLSRDLKRDDLIGHITSASFWQAVHEAASDIIRVSRLLEKGKLAPSIKDRLNPTPVKAPSGGRDDRPAPKPVAAPVQQELESDDVPF